MGMVSSVPEKRPPSKEKILKKWELDQKDSINLLNKMLEKQQKDKEEMILSISQSIKEAQLNNLFDQLVLMALGASAFYGLKSLRQYYENRTSLERFKVLTQATL